MRALLGLLVLGTLFVMAASWQSRVTQERRDHRAQRYGIPSDSVSSPNGWSRLVLGRPSGADPLPLPERVDPPPGGPEVDPGSDGGGGRGRPIPIPADRVYRVKPNDVLGTICQEHYDVRPLADVVDAVATYNDLRSPNSIRSGDTLLLPHPTVLFGRR